MKRCVLLLLAGCTIQNVAAQTSIAPKNEMGLFAETNFANDDNLTPGLAGLQYKHWNGDKAIRILAAVGEYFITTNPEFIGSSGDTVTELYREASIPMAFVGAGLEMQRHFYKKVYLYAAADLKAGVGSGSLDTVTRQKVNEFTSYTISGTSSDGSAHSFILGLTPVLGAKILFRHFAIGTELSAINMDYHSIQFPSEKRTGVLDLSAGVFRERFYVDFRF